MHNTVRGPVVQPGDPDRRQYRECSPLQDAHLGQDRGRRDRRARQGCPDLPRNPAPIPDVHRRGLPAANGQIYHTYPSLKFREDQEALWQATDHGAIQTVATDEICCPLRIKLQGRRIDDTTGGNAGVEPRLSLI